MDENDRLTQSAAAENARLASLYAFQLLDTEPEESFDRIARLAMELLNVPVAKINLIDRDRQWCKSSVGTERRETRRDESFCNWAIRQEKPLVVRDVQDEPRFGALPQIASGPRYRFYAGAALRDEAGNSLGALCCLDFEPHSPTDAQVHALQDLAKLTIEMMQLRKVATTDDLTKAMTRRAFLEAADRDVTLSLRHKRPLSVLMIDLDHFKAINDAYGHAAGDHVLRRTASLMTQQLRASDYIGRLGGEEFGVVLRETPAINALKVADRLRFALSKDVLRFGDVDLRITASLGVAGLEANVADIETLLGCADASLYAAKAGGRNQTMMLTPELIPDLD